MFHFAACRSNTTALHAGSRAEAHHEYEDGPDNHDGGRRWHMLRGIAGLRGYAIRATDGDVGQVEDFHFDDCSWIVGDVVVDTGRWLSGRKVIVPTLHVGLPDAVS